MKRWPIAPVLLLAGLALGGGVVVAVATTHDERDPTRVVRFCAAMGEQRDAIARPMRSSDAAAPNA